MQYVTEAPPSYLARHLKYLLRIFGILGPAHFHASYVEFCQVALIPGSLTGSTFVTKTL